jgi:predicted metalloprotease with PDZ domain
MSNDDRFSYPKNVISKQTTTPPMIRYTVSMPHPNTHYFEVKLEVSEAPRRESAFRFVMPVWTPGSYLIREFERNVLDFKATAKGTGSSLPWWKESKNVWAVESSDLNSLTISYRVYAFEFSDQTSYLDTRHAIINGASVFMYVEGIQADEHMLTIIPYAAWKKISTGLDPLKAGLSEARTFRAPNYDILVDSPIEIGNQDVYEFDVNGVGHEVSLFGPRLIDDQKFVADLRRIVESTWKIIGTIPYSRYVFLVDFNSGPMGGGLEHLNSTQCIVPRLRTLPEEEYRLMMGLFSHEFFHAWNVKRLRPRGLGPFDYSRETYTRSLWIAEGLTSYYDDLILRRAGILSVPEYLFAFSLNINEMKAIPAPDWESAEESSFNTWIQQYRQNENSLNTHSSYYTQGAVIGWILDLEILRSTECKKNLDDVMRKMYTDTYVKENRGYTDEEFERACESIAGEGAVREIFEARVRGRKRIDFDRYLDYAALKLEPKSKVDKPKGYIGVKLKQDSGRSIIASKLFDTPADRAGIAAGDEILAINNMRMDISTIPFFISTRKEGEIIKVLVSRDGYLDTFPVEIARMPTFEYRIVKSGQADDQQTRIFKAWLGSDWERDIVYPEYTPSPQRQKPLDFV